MYYKSSVVSDISLASVTMATVNKRKENKANKSTDKSITVYELGSLQQSICHRSFVLKSSAIVLRWPFPLYTIISRIQVIPLIEKQCTEAIEWGKSNSACTDYCDPDAQYGFYSSYKQRQNIIKMYILYYVYLLLTMDEVLKYILC